MISNMATWDSKAEEYHTKWNTPFYQRLTRKEAGAINRYLTPDTVVVDIGCGTGRLLMQIKARKKIGIDPSEEMLKHASSKTMQANAERIPLEDESADAVILAEVLPYVNDERTALSEAHRILKPGGRIFISSLNWYGVFLFAIPHQRAVLRGRVAYDRRWGYTPRILREKIRNAGFKGQRIHVLSRTPWIYVPGHLYTALEFLPLPLRKTALRIAYRIENILGDAVPTLSRYFLVTGTKPARP